MPDDKMVPRKWNPRSGFQKGHPLYQPHRPRGNGNRPRKEDYEPIASVPDGLVWKPAPFKPARDRVVMFSFGNIYKLERVLSTGAVTYYQKRDAPSATPKEKIDEEPTRGHQVRYRKGATCWFVDAGRWFLVTIEDRTPTLVTIKSVTGWDADRQTPWTFDELLAFAPGPNNPLFRRLRPLKDRYQ